MGLFFVKLRGEGAWGCGSRRDSIYLIQVKPSFSHIKGKGDVIS